MVEMKWTDLKTNEQTGHSFIVLMPQEKDGMPQIYDLTYFKKGKPLTVENNDLEAAIRKEYANDAANPSFQVTTRGNLNEVEAAHYEFVGKHFAKLRTQNWKKSRDAYEKAVSLVPAEFEYNWGLGVAYEKQGKWKEALEIYKKCAEFKEGKNNSWVLGALGVAYAKTGQKDEAVEFLKSALEHTGDIELRHKILNNLQLIEIK
ncbi:TPA: tetratricopeptide repeat protein [Candidatus Micrarchaeota archaeon]|nr:tetratricopeptide repeat protein [Candidatus Micrarchaeota archaeon]